MQYLNSNKASIYLTLFLATKYSITHKLIFFYSFSQLSTNPTL